MVHRKKHKRSHRRQNEPAPNHRRSSHRHNAPASRTRHRRHDAATDMPTMQGLMMPAVAGIGSGLLVAWGAPMAAGWFNMAQTGFMYRLVQGGIAFLGAWGLTTMKILDRTSATVFTAVGVTLAGLGLINDFRMGTVGAPTAAAPAGVPAISGISEPEEEYDTMMGYYEPYGIGPTMGYYEAVA